MNSRLVLATLLLIASGCRKREEAPIPPPGMVDGQGRPITTAAIPVRPAEPAPSAPEAPTVYDFERNSAPDPGALSAPAAAPAPGAGTGASAPAQAATPAPARDLGADLSNALAPLSSCVDVVQGAAQPEGRLTISVTAYVLGSGRVSRATVTAPGQPASALSCMQDKVMALNLTGPIPNAPTQIKGSTQLQIKAVGGDAGQGPAPGAGAIKPAPTSPDIAKPDPGETAGPP